MCFHCDNDRQFLPDPHRYLLFDRSRNSELCSTYFLLDDTPEYYPLFLNTHLEEHIQCSPYLVKVSTESSKFIEWFFTYGKQWGFFYFSEHSLDEALEHWQRIIFPHSNDAKNNTLLRFYDPKVMLSILNDNCLLYTLDASHEEESVNRGGLTTYQKKNTTHNTNQ